MLPLARLDIRVAEIERAYRHWMARLRSCPPSGAPLTEAEMEAQIKRWIKRFENSGVQPDCLKKEISSICDDCRGNSDARFCYTWHGEELRICPPAEGKCDH